MASYVDFINSMLNLRSQKLEEEKLKAQQEQENLSAITSAISSLGSSVGSAVSSYSKNSAANKLMNTATPPRAEAVMPGTTDPNVALNKSAAASVLPGQIPYSEVPVTATPATGGEAELKMRLDMDAESRRRMDATIGANQKERAMGISQGHLDLAQQRAAGTTPDQIADAKLKAEAAAEAAKRQQSADRVAAYEKAYGASTKEFQASEKDAKAFNEATKLTLNTLGDPNITQKQYVDALGFLDSHFQAAQKQGLKVEKPQIASWEESQATKAKQAAIDAATTASTTWDLNPLNNPKPGQIETMQKELEALPGYNKYGPGNVPIVGEGKEATVMPNYLATPTMEKPVYAPPGQPAATPPGQVAAPVAGATATGGGEQTITANEAKQMGISNPIPGRRYEEEDDEGHGTGKFFRVQ